MTRRNLTLTLQSIFIIIAMSITLTSGQPIETWNTTIGGSQDDWGNCVMESSSKSYITVGWTASYGAGETDLWLTSVDTNGDEEWNQTFGGANYDEGTYVQEENDGDYIIVGSTKSYGAGETDVWLIKTDSKGREIWNKTFGTSYYDLGSSVKKTLDNGYIVAGSVGFDNSSGKNADIWLIKTDPNGDEEWNKTFGGSENEWGQTVLVPRNGGYIIAAKTSSYGAGDVDMYLIKTDSEGHEEWNFTFGGPDEEELTSAELTSDGGVILVGWTTSFGTGGKDLWIVKTDAFGNEVWNQTLGGSICDRGYSVQETSDGGYIVTGRTNSYGRGGCDLWLVKTDSLGNEIWNETLGELLSEGGRSIQETDPGNYIIAGWTESYGSGNKDLWLVKMREMKTI